LIHIPPSLTEVLEELEHLKVTGQRVDHPTTGRVRHKDIADALINVVYTLIGEDWDATFERLAGLQLHASQSLNPTSPPSPSPSPSTPSRSDDETIFARLGARSSSSRAPGASGASGYNPARGDRRGRGRHR
jgi:hypothetical protein